jgi:hypothetical protein
MREAETNVPWDDLAGKGDAASMREMCARVAEFCNDGAHIAHDIKSGIFPEQSNVIDVIASKIRALPIPASPTDAAVKALVELLDAIAVEIETEGRVLSNPKLVAKTIRATLAQHGVG